MATQSNVLESASILTGSTGSSPASTSLATLLEHRLTAFYQSQPFLPSPDLPLRVHLPSLQRLTATAASHLLSTLSSLPAAATRTAAPPPGGRPPTFGARDVKTISTLAGIVGRWGIAPRLMDGMLPPSFRDGAGGTARGGVVKGGGANGARFTEVVEQEEEEEDEEEEEVTDGKIGEGKEELRSLVKEILSVVLPSDADGRRTAPDAADDARAQLARVVLPQMFLPLVGALVQLGYEYSHDVEDLGRRDGDGWSARAELDKVFRLTTSATVLATLLALLASPAASSSPSSSSSSSTPAPSSRAWLRPTLTTLLSTQLQRNGGVRALLLLVAGAGDDGDSVPLGKLEMLRRLLERPPEGVAEEIYLNNIIPQLLAILRAALPPSAPTTASTSSDRAPPLQAANLRPQTPPPAPVVRAAAFVLAQFVDRHHASVERLLLPVLHAGLLPGRYPPPMINAGVVEKENQDPLDPTSLDLDPIAVHTSDLLTSLSLISILISYAPPSPHLLPTLLIPLLPSLFSLSAFLAPGSPETKPMPSIFAQADDESETAAVREGVEGLLMVWGRSVEVLQGVREVGRAVEALEKGVEFGEGVDEGGGGGGYYWARGDDGGVCLRGKRRARGSGDVEDDEAMQLRVEPDALVGWFKEVGRANFSGAMFLRWLGEVQLLRSVEGFAAAKKSLLRLQLVLKMVDQLGAEILTEPTQVLAFVAHVLDANDDEDGGAARGSASDAGGKQEMKEGRGGGGLGLDDLRIVEEDDEAGATVLGEDKDDGVVPGLGPDEMVLTAVTLLLAVLEANPDIAMSTTPLLSLIFAKLSLLADSASEIVAPLAREARMVLSLRQASSLAPSSPSTPATPAGATDPLAASRAQYQEALKLLQDPLLPVRAQGLALLRALVHSGAATTVSTDPALLPAILDIFIQAVEDDDSFLYLNAVQGLSAMVDVYGRRMVARLAEVYRGGREGGRDVGVGERGRRELDKRLRVGEALVQVVQRSGEALALLVDDLLPSLLLVLRTATLPTPLRASTLTILATCIETAPLALMQHVDPLAEACLTLLSLESKPLQPRRRPAPEPTTPAAPVPSTSAADSDSDSEIDFEATLAEAAAEAAATAPTPLGRDGKPRRPEETPDPVGADAKHPALRRAALLFLGMLFRTAARLEADRAEERDRRGMDESNPLGGRLRLGGEGRGRTSAGARESRLVSAETKGRARTVLRYVGETDEDGLVRHQAGEVLEEL